MTQEYALSVLKGLVEAIESGAVLVGECFLGEGLRLVAVEGEPTREVPNGTVTLTLTVLTNPSVKEADA